MEKEQPLEEPQPSVAVSDRATTPRSRSRSRSPSSPSWFTPKRLLVMFCIVNLLNYLDRGAIASNGVNGRQKTCKNGVCLPAKGIQGDFDLNNFEDGFLSSAFMVGLLAASPVFATLTKSVNPFRLIGVGLSVWTFATAGCGFSFNLWSITVCRMLVGVGEASFVSLAAPFIDDNAPDGKKTAWLAIFYMCIPAGIALGYVYGGLVGGLVSWRAAFWVESVLMLPFAVLGFVMKPLQLKGFSDVGSQKELTDADVSEIKDGSRGKHRTLSTKKKSVFPFSNRFSKSKRLKRRNQISRFFKDMQVLLLEKTYIVNILGYVVYNFVIGSYAYWGPKAGYNIYHMQNADLIFGGITIICGIVGTVAGGYILDFMTSTIKNAFKLISVASFAGAAFCFGAFCSGSMHVFLALFAIGELLVFATQGPVSFICLHCVKPSLRPLSMAISTVSIHIFGDVPSSPLYGILQDYVHNWRKTTLILTSILFLASGIWFTGVFIDSVDRYNEDCDSDSETENDSKRSAPLLEEKTAETAQPSNEP